MCSAQPAPNVEEATLPAGAAPTATPNPAAEMAPDPPRSRAVLAPRGGGGKHDERASEVGGGGHGGQELHRRKPREVVADDRI